MAMTKEGRDRIRELNDCCRTALGIGAVVFQTEGITALPKSLQSRIREAVEQFETFTPDNDPYGEHDFGAILIEGHRIYWKIDYYDPTYTQHSEDAADPILTRRVLTIMLAAEY